MEDPKAFIVAHTGDNAKTQEEIDQIFEACLRDRLFKTAVLIEMHRAVRSRRSGVAAFKRGVRAAILASVHDREGALRAINYLRERKERALVAQTCAPFVLERDVLEYKAQTKRRSLQEVGRLLETERRRKKIE